MIDLNGIHGGMILISHEEDPLWAEEPNKREKVLIGTVADINYKTGEVTLRLNRELRIFKPENLWYLPYEARNAPSAPTDKSWMLKGFIVSVAEGKVSPSTLREIAEEFKKQGAKPAAPQELLEARV